MEVHREARNICESNIDGVKNINRHCRQLPDHPITIDTYAIANAAIAIIASVQDCHRNRKYAKKAGHARLLYHYNYQAGPSLVTNISRTNLI